jgi:antirestriction protein ArdC
MAFASNKTDVYQAVTDGIVAALESGTLPPWVKPWSSTGASSGLPRNGATGREYNGINVVILWAAAMTRDYADPRWVTFKQAQALGGSVRKGEKAALITFWRSVEIDEVDEQGRKKRIPVVRGYHVFNVEQCDGIPASAPVVDAARGFEVAAQILDRSGAAVVHGGDVAAYSPALDRIVLPEAASFASIPAYWATALHELTHWSGHGSRLGRDLSGRFGTESYAVEELVAELGAAFLCARAGVDGQLQHAEYVGSWLRVLKADKRAIFTAAARARDAADFLCQRAGLTAADDDAEESAA